MPQLQNHQNPRSPDSMLHARMYPIFRMHVCSSRRIVHCALNLMHARACCACLRGLSHVPTCTYSSSSIFRTLYSPSVSIHHRLICPEFPYAFLDRGGGGGGETQYMLLHRRGGLLVSSRMVTTMNTRYMYACKPEAFVLVSSHEADAALSTSRCGIHSTQRRGNGQKGVTSHACRIWNLQKMFGKNDDIGLI
jgi:hypothetical protein